MSDAEPVDAVDPLREQLLDAAARVFARQGFAGTKILDIVKEAGLSTGAVYGRFKSKNELLREAVVRRSDRVSRIDLDGIGQVADVIKFAAGLHTQPLSDNEAVRLEAFVTARREEDVAAALADAQAHWRDAIQPLVDAALKDGTVADGVDPESVVYFIRTMHMGLLLQRAAGITPPDRAGWEDLVNRIVASFGDGKARRTK